MLILDTVSKINKDSINIPLYHRGHLSLLSGTKVTCCLFPANGIGAGGQLTEMVVSPISFSSWRWLWRITVVFKEQQGVVHKLLSIIRDINLNVLYEESSSIESRGFHEIELIVDSSTASSLGGTEEDNQRGAAALERRILALCSNEIYFRRSQPCVKVRRMRGLRRAWEKYNEIIGEQGLDRNLPTIDRASIERGRLMLSGEIFNYLSARKSAGGARACGGNNASRPDRRAHALST